MNIGSGEDAATPLTSFLSCSCGLERYIHSVHVSAEIKPVNNDNLATRGCEPWWYLVLGLYLSTLSFGHQDDCRFLPRSAQIPRLL